MGKGLGPSMPSLSLPLSLNLHVFTNLEALLTELVVLSFYGGFIIHVINKTLAIGECFPTPPPHFPPRGVGLEMKVSTL